MAQVEELANRCNGGRGVVVSGVLVDDFVPLVAAFLVSKLEMDVRSCLYDTIEARSVLAWIHAGTPIYL